MFLFYLLIFLLNRDPVARQEWQTETRQRVEHLLMAGNPPAVNMKVSESRVIINESYSEGTLSFFYYYLNFIYLFLK